MSKIFDALKQAEARREDRAAPIPTPRSPQAPAPGAAPPRPAGLGHAPQTAGSPRPFQVVTVTSNKGGVGKTTIATNLAVYARAMREDLPLLLMGFDDQTTIDRMFALDAAPPNQNLENAFDQGHFQNTTCVGQFGIEYIPAAQNLEKLKQRIQAPEQLEMMLRRSERSGLVVIDTKSDFEILTRTAIDTSDLTIVVVKDQASLIEARRVFEHLARAGRPATAARVVISLVDLRVKFREGEDRDVLGHLLSEIRREGFPLFESFLSRSPKVESLHTNPSGRPVSVLAGAPGSLPHRQYRNLTREVLAALAPPSPPNAT